MSCITAQSWGTLEHICSFDKTSLVESVVSVMNGWKRNNRAKNSSTKFWVIAPENDDLTSLDSFLMCIMTSAAGVWYGNEVLSELTVINKQA
jgi:hypothetical protein